MMIRLKQKLVRDILDNFFKSIISDGADKSIIDEHILKYAKKPADVVILCNEEVEILSKEEEFEMKNAFERGFL